MTPPDDDATALRRLATRAIVISRLSGHDYGLHSQRGAEAFRALWEEVSALFAAPGGTALYEALLQEADDARST